MAVELIAEVSSNHGGDIELAKAFIWQYAATGADWVKFQSYQVKTLRPNDPQREWLAKAELSDDAHHILKAECERAGVKFLTTVFHHSRVPFLAGLGLERIKIGSGEARDQALRGAVMTHFSSAFISDGMRHFPRLWWGHCFAIWLRCESRYPHPSAFANAHYDHDEPGYSDHSVGIEGPMIAISCGATVIEKHVSLPEKKRERRSWEATVQEFKELRALADDDPHKYLGRWQHTPTE